MKIDKKFYKNIGICNIGCFIIKKIDDYENTNSANTLYLFICNADGNIEENNGNKYLVFISTDGNENMLANFTNLWGEMKHFIEIKIEGKIGECEKDFMKIKFNSDDNNIPLNEILRLRILIVIVRSVFEEDGKHYPQLFLNECLYEL